MRIAPTLLFTALLATGSSTFGQLISPVAQRGRFSSLSLEQGRLFVTGFSGMAAWGETARLNLHEFSTSLILCQAQQGSLLIFAQALGHITFSNDAGQSWRQIMVPDHRERTHQIQIGKDGIWLISSRGPVQHLNRSGQVLESLDPPAPGEGVQDALWHRDRFWLLTSDGNLWSREAGQWRRHPIQGHQAPVVLLPAAEREEPDIVAESGAIYWGGRWWWSSDFRKLPSRARFARSGSLVYASYVRTERVRDQHRVLHLIRILEPKANRVDLSREIQVPVTPAAIALEEQDSDYRIAVANASQPFDVRTSEGGTGWRRLGFAMPNPQVHYPPAAGAEPGQAIGEHQKEKPPF